MALMHFQHSFVINDLSKDTVHISDDFKTSIQTMIKNLDGKPNQLYSIQFLTSKFHFHKRRLYDVLNVYESIGIYKKLSVDSLLWIGFANINKTLKHIANRFKLFDEGFDINNLALTENSISISILTQRFLLLFLAINANNIDIKQSSKFLSKKNDKYKTILCKLYQITYILESSDIISKSSKTGEVIFNSKYSDIETVDSNQPLYILSVQSLLNNHDNSKIMYERRRNYFDLETIDVKQDYFPISEGSDSPLYVDV